jgi:hypothetical protein
MFNLPKHSRVHKTSMPLTVSLRFPARHSTPWTEHFPGAP